MAQETLNWVLALIAVLAAVGNIIAFLVARVELQGQRKETRGLTKLTSELDSQIKKMTYQREMFISQLNRARDLIREIHSAYQYQIGVTTEPNSFPVQTALLELRAIAEVINNNGMKEAVDDLEKAIYNLGSPSEPRLTGNSSNLEQPTLEMMRKIYELSRDVFFDTSLLK